MALKFEQQYTMDFLSLRDILDPDHILIKLADAIDWDGIHDRLSPYYSCVGRQAHPVRLMIGLHLLKHLYNVGDESAVARLKADIYWMYFCDVEPARVGSEYMKRFCPTSLVKFRQRIGTQGMAEVEAVLAQLLPKARKTMTIDSTTMPKNIVYPTDSGLLYKGRVRLLTAMEKMSSLAGVKLPKTLRRFRRKAKKTLLHINKLGKGRKERIREGTLELARQAVHVLGQSRKFIRAASSKQGMRKQKNERALRKAATHLRRTIAQVKQVVYQARERFKGHHVPEKLYSYHEPQVVCLRKGQRRGDEYGSKVSLQFDEQGFVRAHRVYFTNRSDFTTMTEALELWEKKTGTLPEQVNADRGYVTDEKSRRGRQVKRWCIPRKGKRAGPNEKKPWFRRGQRRRAGSEAEISHLKRDHRMGRSYYHGYAGDQSNVLLAMMAYNLKKVVRFGLLPAPG